MGQISTSRSSLTITVRGYIVSSHPDLAMACVRVASAKSIYSPCQPPHRDSTPHVPARLSRVFLYSRCLVPGNEVESNPSRGTAVRFALDTMKYLVLRCTRCAMLCRGYMSYLSLEVYMAIYIHCPNCHERLTEMHHHCTHCGMALPPGVLYALASALGVTPPPAPDLTVGAIPPHVSPPSSMFALSTAEERHTAPHHSALRPWLAATLSLIC